MLKKGDFIEMQYTGRLSDDGKVFDTTDLNLAKKEGVFSDQMVYGSIVICIGDQQLVKGLDDALVGKELNKAYSIKLTAQESFGKKDPKMLKIMNTNLLLDKGVRPAVGMQLNVDGVFGVVKSTSSGRTIVDFNHPYAGKDVVYEVKVNRLVEDVVEKISSFLKVTARQKKPMIKPNGDTLEVTIKGPLTPEAEKKLKDKLTKIAKPKKISLTIS